MRTRYYFLLFVFGAVSLIWAAYLFSIQMLDPFNFSGERRIRYIPKKEILIPRRGAILDAKGNLLVSSVSYYQVDVDRAAVTSWVKRDNKSLDEAFASIAKLISANSSLSYEAVLKRLNLGNKNSSIQISNKISEAELDKIIKDFKAKGIPGLSHSFASMKRIYSKDILAARVLGSVREVSDGYDMATDSRSLYKLSGICGIESTYDKLLSGNYGWREIVLDANRQRVP